ncbi:BnaCnng76540D [Brassica napus]|uniref:BnaCnng76540D protein n=1 Tax=Brassica napus TaxID=3708 RepID=A0A078K0M6_BRANA|nr:BnaCnng76540D [Brassica napus]
MCILDHLFAQQWRFNFKDFKDSKPDQNGLGRRLPGGAHWIAIWISIPKRHIVVFDSICSSISPEELDVFSKKDFAKTNGKSMRDKMAVDIFQELPDAHEFENKDMDDILGTYDG